MVQIVQLGDSHQPDQVVLSPPQVKDQNAYDPEQEYDDSDQDYAPDYDETDFVESFLETFGDKDSHTDATIDHGIQDHQVTTESMEFEINVEGSTESVKEISSNIMSMIQNLLQSNRIANADDDNSAYMTTTTTTEITVTYEYKRSPMKAFLYSMMIISCAATIITLPIAIYQMIRRNEEAIAEEEARIEEAVPAYEEKPVKQEAKL